MKKKVVITSLTAATLAMVSLMSGKINTVKADTVSAGNIQSAKSQKEVAQENVGSAKKQVADDQAQVNNAQADLSDAQSNAEKPDADYTAQSSKVEKAQADVNAKQKAKETAQNKEKQAEQIAQEAKNPANIEKAKQDVVNKQNDIKNQNADLNATKAKQPAKQKAIDKANKDVKTAQDNLTNKNNAKTAADTKVKNAQDALKGTRINEAKDALAKTQSKIKQYQIDKNTLNNINSEYSKASVDYLGQNGKDSKKQKADAAAQAYAQKNDEVKKLEASINKLKDLSKNTINIGDVAKYSKAYEDYVSTGNLTQDDIDYFDSLTNEFHSINGDNTEVDINNLTPDQEQEIALFTSDIINKVRSQFGVKSSDEVNTTTINFAKAISQRYLADYKSGAWTPGWHDAI